MMRRHETARCVSARRQLKAISRQQANRQHITAVGLGRHEAGASKRNAPPSRRPAECEHRELARHFRDRLDGSILRRRLC